MNSHCEPIVVDPIKAITRASECTRRLMEKGVTLDDMQAVIDDPVLRAKVVRFWKFGGIEPVTTQSIAREIMGENYFGIEEAIKHYQITPSADQLERLREVPFTAEQLRKRNNTHILIAVFPNDPISVIRDDFPELFNPACDASFSAPLSSSNRFLVNYGDLGWHLISRCSMLNSQSPIYEDQLKMPREKERLPSARTLVYMLVGYFLSTHKRLFESVLLSTSDWSGQHDQVMVGNFNQQGMWVRNFSKIFGTPNLSMTYNLETPHIATECDFGQELNI